MSSQHHMSLDDQHVNPLAWQSSDITHEKHSTLTTRVVAGKPSQDIITDLHDSRQRWGSGAAGAFTGEHRSSPRTPHLGEHESHDLRLAQIRKELVELQQRLVCFEVVRPGFHLRTVHTHA